MKKITIITVVYNDKKGLERTIQSVLSQTYDSIEYIIIDGGSTDGSVDVIKKYEDQIDKWVSEPDDGIYDAMNKGIKMATGEWLNFMNAGDLFVNESIVEKVFSLNISDGVDFLYSNYWQSESDGKYYWHRADREQGFVHHQSSIYKRHLHDIYGYYLTQRPYSVYDLLFFLSVPVDAFLKVPFEIAMNDGGGVSGRGHWAWEKSEALRVLFGLKSLKSAYFTYLKIRFRDSMPKALWEIIDRYLLGKKTICLSNHLNKI